MDEVRALLDRLMMTGVPMNPSVRDAMAAVDPRDFTDWDLGPFLNDRPVVFMERGLGRDKTISAPHMIATLLFHAELRSGHATLVIGAKGGYFAALIGHIMGPEGTLQLLDPSMEVLHHVKTRLSNDARIQLHHCAPDVAPSNLPPIDRVIITGRVDAPPDWISEVLCNTGFVIAPIGGAHHQRLMKLERIDGSWAPTDLGGVCFGPIDVDEDQIEVMQETGLSDMMHETTAVLEALELVDLGTIHRLRDLATDVEHADGPDEIGQLMKRASSWLEPVWPLIAMVMSGQLSESHESGTTHEDFIP